MRKTIGTLNPKRERIPPGGFMDILAALKQEEAKLEKQVSVAQQQLDAVRGALRILGRGVASNEASSGKATGKTKRVLSAAARAKMAKAQKERWARFRAAKAKAKQ